jgi:hypothetical protein
VSVKICQAQRQEIMTYGQKLDEKLEYDRLIVLQPIRQKKNWLPENR